MFLLEFAIRQAPAFCGGFFISNFFTQHFHIACILVLLSNQQIKQMEYKEALRIATETLDLLRPHCYRCEIAGSIRRKKPEVKDIEIVAIPKPYEIGLLESGIATVVNRWECVKGKLPCKYTQRILPQGIKLDLFIVEETNWGLQFAIRTGSAEYSHRLLARTWARKGYKSEGGYLIKDGIRYEIREEKDLYKMLGITYIDPEFRFLPV